MNYDRRAGVRLESVTHKAAEADELVAKTYLALHSLKAGFDSMEEIPSYLAPMYRQLMVTLGEVGDARNETHQLREMMRRVFR